MKRVEKDLFSSVFESKISVEERSKLGQYFTHQEIVDIILNNMPINEETKILDPTCGAGAFLVKVLDKNKGISKNVYGVDIDSKALSLCKLNLSESHKVKDANLIEADFIKTDIFKERDFDVILGNPPFKNLKSDNKDYPLDYPIFQDTTSGIANAATLVMAKSYVLLKDGGYLGFVLPKNLARVESFKKMRDFLIKNTRLIAIIDIDHHFKDVRGDQIVLIFRKQKLSEADLKRSLVKIVPYKKGISLSEQESYSLPQSEFMKYSSFPIFYNLKVKELADKLLSIKSCLNDKAEIFRGLSVSSNSPLISKETLNGHMPTLRGHSIKRLGVKYKLFLNSVSLNQNDKKKLNRLLREKIALQNISSKEGGLFATISDKNEATLDTVTNIIPHESEDMDFLLALICSNFSNFFMIQVIYLNSNFAMHTDKHYIGQIPFVSPTKEDVANLKTILNEMLKIDDKYSKRFNELYKSLNMQIYKVYNLKPQEIEVLESSLKEVMSKKRNG